MSAALEVVWTADDLQTVYLALTVSRQIWAEDECTALRAWFRPCRATPRPPLTPAELRYVLSALGHLYACAGQETLAFVSSSGNENAALRERAETLLRRVAEEWGYNTHQIDTALTEADQSARARLEPHREENP